ncbi:hypothetical protein MKW92_040565 [Papaver armeniacum]|nr:hypothetical protein MKW92_040565 [Papaver armeniacum]
MNVLPCSVNTLKGIYDISGVEVGQHFYWQIGGSAAIAVRNPQIIPTNGQNFFEYKSMVLEFPLLERCSYLFLFLTGQGALLPRKIIQLPHRELAAPMNDINATVALALLTYVAYFYAEDFTKPLSLSFRLFENILADELVVVVLVSLVPSVVPIPVMFLGLFTSGIQALIFATLAAAYIGESMEGHH